MYSKTFNLAKKFIDDLKTNDFEYAIHWAEYFIDFLWFENDEIPDELNIDCKGSDDYIEAVANACGEFLDSVNEMSEYFKNK